MDQTKKKIKPNTTRLLAPETRVFISLNNPYGEEVINTLELPVESTKEQLQAILNQLLK